MTKTLIWSVLILTFISTALFAQNSKISGKINDAKNDALAGASVVIKGTTKGKSPTPMVSFRLKT